MRRGAGRVVVCLLVPAPGGAAPFQDSQIWTNVTATGRLERVVPALKGWLRWAEAQGGFGNEAATVS